MNDSIVLLVGSVAWPIVVLIVGVLLLATQRAPLGRLIDRIKSLKYPGGEAELDSVPEAGADKIKSTVDALARDPLAEHRERQLALPTAGAEGIELIPSREPLVDFEPLPLEEVTNLVTLRAQVTVVLQELAFPPPPGGFGPSSATIETLLNRGVLDGAQAQALRDTLAIADQAASGAIVPQRVATAVKNSGPAIVEQLALLRTVAAARFEDHVLETLQNRASAEWSIDLDVAITGDEQRDRPASDPPSATKRHTLVDALVTVGERAVIVEVRARLQRGAVGQVEAVCKWMKGLPSDLPILLIMLGEGLTGHELRRITEGHRAPVEILEWDQEANSFIRVLRGLLGSLTLLPARDFGPDLRER